MSPSYWCTNGCFGTEPFHCDHGGSGKTPGGPRGARVTLTQAMQILKALGQARHPRPPENLWVRNVAPRESVRQAYATHRADVAAAKRQRRAMPLGPCVVDADGVPRSADEFFNHSTGGC